tara:strand:+ start:165 stop:791 length:627 start_codon:yes stop_codon:yes gene_type:complete
MNFSAESANAPQEQKKNFNDLATDFYPYWKPYFESIGNMNPVFKSKLCYNSKEFPEGKVPGVRFFESELNILEPIYVECVDWDTNFYDPMNRTLYVLQPNVHWKGEPDKYVRSNNVKLDTYAVRLTDLELVNKTSITEKTPRIATIPATPVVEMEEDEYSEMYMDMEDNHLSSMTMRDQYCITHNVPMSNKSWLNELILNGKKWLKEN